MKTFPYIKDAGHGWVRVPMTELAKAGCEADISKYSYQKGRNVFLEEDADLQVFVDARAKQGQDTKFAEYVNKSRPSRIRNYPVYTAPEGVQPTQVGAAYLESVESEDPMDDFNYVGHPAHY